MKIDKKLRILLVLFATFAVAMAFAAFFLLLYFPTVSAPESPVHPLNLVIIIIAFWAYLVCAIVLARALGVEFARRFYDLSREDAQALVMRLLDFDGGVPLGPILRVQEGRANLDAPAVFSKVGGPGYLSIAHDSAAVTSQLGRLHQVYGPGFHKLEPFERVWDVVDLRWQHRTLRVEFMTLDGIPAYCSAEIRFRVASGPDPSVLGVDADYLGEETVPAQPFPFSKDAVLKLVTSKYVKSREGIGRVNDWRAGLVNGALDGEMRDCFERYSLDEMLNPDGDAAPQHPQPALASVAGKLPYDLKVIEADIEAKVKHIGEGRGIEVAWVRLDPVRPVDEHVYQQWLAFWQARQRYEVDKRGIDAEKIRMENFQKATISAQVELLTGLLDESKKLREEGLAVPSQLLVMSFMDVLRTMADRDPAVQQLMYQQAESLTRIVNAVQKDKPPFGDGKPAQQDNASGTVVYLPTSPSTD